MTTVVGTFANREAAERAVGVLVGDGIDPDSVGIVMRDITRTEPEDIEVITYEEHHDTAGHEAGKGAAGGAIGGATAGAGTMLLAAAGVALVPGIGALLALGTAAATAAAAAAGAAGGAAAGGIFGAVIGAGDQEATKVTEEQTRYREVIDHEGALVSVDADHDAVDDAVRSLEEAGAGEVTTLREFDEATEASDDG